MSDKLNPVFWITLAIIFPFLLAYIFVLSSRAISLEELKEVENGLSDKLNVVDIASAGHFGSIALVFFTVKAIISQRNKLKKEIALVLVLLTVFGINLICLL